MNKEKISKIINNHILRTSLARESHLWFFNLYLPHYVKFPTAPFQKEMFYLTEDDSTKLLGIMAFRGSSKSTIMTLSYPIWAILGKQEKKFILILSQTQSQARQHLQNLKTELEHNELLRQDLGPFEESDDEWRSFSLVIPKYNARITTASLEQSIRGIRHKEHRPDLIICDDIEDLNSVKTKEGRDKTYQWLTSDVIPAGNVNTRIVIIGNLLHEDSALMRIKEKIKKKEMDGVWKDYPLIDNKKRIAWPGQFPNKKSILNSRRAIGNESAWQREYLLRIISDIERVIFPEWINYYDKLPKDDELSYAMTTIDLAISQKESASYTAMVSGKIYERDDKLFIYVLPNSVNERLTSPQTLERAKLVSNNLGDGYQTKLVIEQVGYQTSLIEQLKDDNFPAEGFELKGQDKRARLALTGPMVQSGQVLFPRKGAEKIIQQIIRFGSEKHNDLADAFAMLVLHAMRNRPGPGPNIRFLELGEPNDSNYSPLSDRVPF